VYDDILSFTKHNIHTLFRWCRGRKHDFWQQIY